MNGRTIFYCRCDYPARRNRHTRKTIRRSDAERHYGRAATRRRRHGDAVAAVHPDCRYHVNRYYLLVRHRLRRRYGHRPGTVRRGKVRCWYDYHGRSVRARL